MNEEEARDILERYKNGNCTSEEKAMVELWLSSLEDKGREWTVKERELFQKKLKAGIDSRIGDRGVRRSFPGKQILRVAMVLLIVTSGLVAYYFFTKQAGNIQPEISEAETVVNDIEPGVNGAILTLANGEKLVLDSAGNGTLAVQSNINVLNIDGQLIYEGDVSDAGATTYNTVSTPRARQFRLQLSDGTKVWLNAGSYIKYPVQFGSEARRVEVSGEVFFEVTTVLDTKGKRIPFWVDIITEGTAGGVIEVTGTQFNVNAYSDDMPLKTTLVEGGIRYSKGKISRVVLPGEQIQLNQEGTVRVVRNVNVDAEVAWKNGYFTYDRTDIQVVMKQLERWYDIEIEYKNGKVPNEKYWGDIERNATLSDVLKILELSGVKFKLDGKKLIVTGS